MIHCKIQIFNFHHHCCLQITEKHGCVEARASLLEKKGDVHGAFAGLLQVKHLKERSDQALLMLHMFWSVWL